MTGVGFLILFGLSCVLFSCEGQIYSPCNKSMITFLPGSNARLKWTSRSGCDLSKAETRIWYFTRRSDGSIEKEIVVKNGISPTEYNTSLPGVVLEPPATLVLKNVDVRYNGRYRILSQAGPNCSGGAGVDVFIAVTPNVTINCSSSTTLNEGENVICVCRGEGGNPPANVTWYKYGVQNGGTGKEEQTLTLRNVNGTDSGTYKCVAQSHVNATNETSIEIIVKLNFKPKNTSITFTKNPAVVDRNVVVKCESNGLPEPSYTIFHNDTMVINNSIYTIDVVKYSHAGTYQCNASNRLGNDLASANLTVEPRPPTTIQPSKTPSGKPPEKPTSEKSTTTKGPVSDPSEPCPVWCIVIIVIAVVVVLVIIAYVVYRYKKKEKDGYRSSCFRENADVSPGASVGIPVNHYELDEAPDGGVDNADDTVNNPGASGSKSKLPANTTPDVYAAVDKKNREGKPLYATLDSLALEQTDNSKKKQ